MESPKASPWKKSILLSFVLVLLIAPVSEAGIADVFRTWTSPLMNKALSLMGVETCEHPNIHDHAGKRLKNAIKKELFGQHLAADIALKAVKAHWEDKNPGKALVLSMHGWAGAGKTFTSQLIINALYERGHNSSFIKFFMSSYHFPDPNKVEEYRELIKKHIEEVVKKCPRALFIFDEVDKTPAGVLDALVPYIQHPGELLDGSVYKKAIYIFITNTGATDITRITQEAWKEGKKREDLTFKDFQDVLSNEAFNSDSKSGLYRSRIIDKVLVDYFIPFLPMERRHIISCIKAEARRYGMNSSIIDIEAENIADLLTYWPADLKLYSTTGCKRVDTFVKYRMAELQDDIDDEDDDEVDDSVEGILKIRAKTEF